MHLGGISAGKKQHVNVHGHKTKLMQSTQNSIGMCILTVVAVAQVGGLTVVDRC